MRIVTMVFGITFLFMSVLPVTQAYADGDKHMKNPCQKKEYKEYREKHMQKKKLKMRMMKLMDEAMGMWLEAVQLVKESAGDSGIKKKAAALEKRMRANINEHKALHKKMHGMHKKHEEHEKGEKMHKGHSNPCG